MLVQERLRRSAQRFEYVKLNLLNLGALIVLLAPPSIIGDQTILDGISTNRNFFLVLLAGLSMVSVILYRFWCDDAIMIAGTDRLIRSQEERLLAHDGAPPPGTGAVPVPQTWYDYRTRKLNGTKGFRTMGTIFAVAILVSFALPAVIGVVFRQIDKVLAIPMWVSVFGGLVFAIALLLPFLIWRKFSGSPYGERLRRGRHGS